MSRSSFGQASVLHVFSSTAIFKPAALRPYPVHADAPRTCSARRNVSQLLRVSPRQSGAIHANTGAVARSFDDVVRRISNACRASVAHRIARICRSALRFLDPPLLSVQTAARPIAWWWSSSMVQPDTQRHSRRTNRRGGKCCECVTRVRNGVVASESGPSNPRALMKHTPARQPMHTSRTTRCASPRGIALPRRRRFGRRFAPRTTRPCRDADQVRAFGGCAR